MLSVLIKGQLRIQSNSSFNRYNVQELLLTIYGLFTKQQKLLFTIIGEDFLGSCDVHELLLGNFLLVLILEGKAKSL